MKIERCKISDKAAIMRLEKAYLKLPWSESDIESALKGENGYVLYKATNEEKMLGYGGVQVVLDEASIMNIAVDEGSRRQGVATALLGSIEDSCRAMGARLIFLEVGSGNTAARALYTKHGYAEIYTRKGYYGSSDAIVMSKEL